jgi:hypothetical protein
MRLRTDATKAISSLSFRAGWSKLTSMPKGTPGASSPASATDRNPSSPARKMPSVERPPPTCATNATCPAAFSAGKG